jgi:hypothetical protein
MDLSGMPKTVEEWIWWVNLVFTILMILTGAAGALTLKKSGCLGTVFKAMWLPLVLFAITQMVTLFGPAFTKDQPASKETVKILCSSHAELEACNAMMNTEDPPARACTWEAGQEAVDASGVEGDDDYEPGSPAENAQCVAGFAAAA